MQSSFPSCRIYQKLRIFIEQNLVTMSALHTLEQILMVKIIKEELNSISLVCSCHLQKGYVEKGGLKQDVVILIFFLNTQINKLKL